MQLFKTIFFSSRKMLKSIEGQSLNYKFLIVLKSEPDNDSYQVTVYPVFSIYAVEYLQK